MGICYYCGREVDLPFRCPYCGLTFCSDHRLPEQHNCINMPKQRSWKIFREERTITMIKIPRVSKSIEEKVQNFSHETKVQSISHKTKTTSIKKIVLVFSLMIIVAIIGFHYYGFPIVYRPNVKLPIQFNISQPKSKEPSSIATTESKIEVVPTKYEIINKTITSLFLTLNKEREKYGLPKLKLMITGIAQFRAEDMINRSYFGHYDPEGYPPFYYYTKMGGVYSLQENVAETRYIDGYVEISEIEKIAVSHILDMIYNDSLSNWGHRDSLLDPANNFVDIGLYWNSQRVVIVIHMIGRHVEWINPPSIENMTFIASGILDENVSFSSVIIYYHPPPQREFVFRQYYEIGSPIAGVAPEPYYYPDIATWRPVHWDISSNKFDISFKIKPIFGSGFYTIVIWVKNNSGILHPYDPERSNHWSILEYSIFVK